MIVLIFYKFVKYLIVLTLCFNNSILYSKLIKSPVVMVYIVDNFDTSIGISSKQNNNIINGGRILTIAILF